MKDTPSAEQKQLISSTRPARGPPCHLLLLHAVLCLPTSASTSPVLPASSRDAGTAESHGAGTSPERLTKTRASFRHQPMFMAWPDWTKPVGFCVPGPGEMPGEDTDTSWSQLHPCYLPSAGLFRRIAFLLPLLRLSYYKGALHFSKHLISNVPERGCGTDPWLARRGVGFGGADPCPHPCSPNTSLGSSLLTVPP